LKGLQTLNLYGTKVTDAGLAHLGELTGLRSLDLTSTEVTGAGLAHLKECKELRTLILCGRQVTDAGLAHVKELKGLQFLCLPYTRVTDAGLTHLKELKGLQRLNLYDTEVTGAGLAHLKELEGLQSLHLGGQQVTDAGVAHLKELKGLPELCLSGTKVTDAGLAHLKDLKGLQTLSLQGTPVTGPGLAQLKELKGLRELNLLATQVTDADLTHLRELKGLVTLSLERTQVTDAGLAHLKELEGLQTLNLSGTKVTDAGLAHLKELKGLRSVSVGGTRVTEHGLVELSKLLRTAARAAQRAEGAPEGKPQCYRAGDVGVFAAAIALPADVDLNTAAISVQPKDDKVYLLYVSQPTSVIERLRAAEHHEQPRLSAEQQAKVAAVDRQIAELHRGAAYPQAVQENNRELQGLRGVAAAEERKKEGRDEALVARTRERIAELEAANRKLQADWQTGAAERNKKVQELQRQRNEVWAAARAQGREVAAAEPTVVIGRFQGAGKSSITVFVRKTDELLAEARPVATVELDLPAADGGDPELLKEWALAQARQFTDYVLRSPFSSFYQYCLLQSVRKYGVPEDELPPRLRRAGRPERRADLYSIATGYLAVQESLQLDAMTGRTTIPEDRGVAIDSLKGPDIKSHPFDKMLEGRKPRLDPVAALVPFDAYYCHFTSISKEIATRDLINQWGTGLIRSASVSARDCDLGTKYQEQLCIGVSVLTRLFGDLLIGEIAITGNDPFLIEGTDLTVLIQVKNRALFDQQMKSYLDDALAAQPDAASAMATYQGVPIRSVTTPDRRIASHSTNLGDYAVYSNSLDALKRVIDTHAKRRPSMADNLDFQYMRTIFPSSPQAEDGFIYLSDAFIRKLVGPRWKIEGQRRIVCQNHLRMIGNAATMYRTELRKKPTLETLTKEKYLPDPLWKCPNSGTYSLDPTGRAYCSVHNCLRYCTPVDSVALDKVSNAEAEDYRRFVQNYNEYWRQYFDPIGIRFKVGNRIEVETCILPLIENSIYNQVRDLIGGKPVALNARVLTDHTILSVAAKLDLNRPEYREMAEGIQSLLPPGILPVTKAVGSSLSLSLYDSDVLFTGDDRSLATVGDGMPLGARLFLVTCISAIQLPIYGIIELQDEKLAQTIIRELIKAAEAAASMQGEGWGEVPGRIDHYAAGKHGDHEINVFAASAVIKFRFYYAIASKRLIIATKRYVLEDVLDALDKAKAAGDDAAANVQLDILPRAYDKLLPVTTIGWMERMREACHKNLVPIRALVECQGATEETLEAVSRRVEGVVPRCPCQGAYRHDPARGTVYCTIHGDPAHPQQPLRPSGKEELMLFLSRLRDVSVSFRFTDEGIMTKVTLDLDPAKP